MKQYAFSAKPEKVDSSSPEPSTLPLRYPVTLNHLIRMGMTQGWKEHTWFRVQELENHPLGLWNGIQEEFLREIEHAKAKVRADQELQADRDQAAAQTLRRVETSGGSQVDSGAVAKVTGQ